MAAIYSVLVTGANRGIGLEFVNHFLTNSEVKPEILIAACRSPEKAAELQELKKSNANVHLLKLDVSQFNTYEKVASEVKGIVGDRGLTLLINNAGVGPGSDTLDQVTPEEFISKFTTNSVAPVMLTKVLRPLLKCSAQVNSTGTNGLSIKRAAVINISSYLGSIGLNDKSGRWTYRESKAALNMSTQSLAIELEPEGILVEAIHPGHVRTDMGGPAGAIDTTTSVAGMISVILKLKGKNKKGFYTWAAEEYPY